MYFQNKFNNKYPLSQLLAMQTLCMNTYTHILWDLPDCRFMYTQVLGVRLAETKTTLFSHIYKDRLLNNVFLNTRQTT